MHLYAQELRNCLYPGPFNNLMIELAGHKHFTDLFGIPPHKKHVSAGGRVSPALSKNSLYKRMTDCEYVLRFFAFRRADNLRGSIPKMLDDCMRENAKCSPAEIDDLRSLFLTRLEFVVKRLGQEVFRLPDDKTRRTSLPLYDAVLIAVDRLWKHREALAGRRARILAGMKKLLRDQENYDVIIGKPGTAKAIRARMTLVKTTLESAAGLAS